MAARARVLAMQVGLAAALATTARVHAQPLAQPATPPMSAPTDSGSVAAPSPAPASQPPAPEPTAAAASSAAPAAQVSAREAYARGQALFTEGKYAEAKLEFDRAYALVANPIVLLSSAECDVRLGNIEAAHAQLQRYLSERPDAPDRAQVEQKAAALQAMPALLMLTSEPRGASVGLDGKDTGARTPAAIYVRPGEHQVAFMHPGYASASEQVVARMGARQTLRLSLQPLPGTLASTPPKLAPAAESTDPDNAPIWVSAILSGAAFATGGVLGVLALQQQQKFEDHPTHETADRGERLALFADVAFGVGVIAGITTAVLIFAGNEAQSAPNAARADRVAISPLALSHGAGLRASGRF